MPENLRFADICSDSFMLVLQLRGAQDFGDPGILRERILNLLDNMEHQARRHNFNLDEVQKAKFALVSFIDETIIASDWPQKQTWLSNPLQLQLYNRFDAGEEFFVKLEDLRRRFQSNIQVLEVYYLCLVLGFKGKYGILEPERLRVIMDELFQDIQQSYDKSLRMLSPNGKRKEEITEVIKKEIPVWIFGVGATALGLLLYLVFVLLARGTADDVVSLMRAIL
jgi:type VI secretion system protein ImpK